MRWALKKQSEARLRNERDASRAQLAQETEDLVNAITRYWCQMRRNCIKLDEMLQKLEQRRQEDANKISCQRVNLQNLRIKVQRDADQVAAEESALEVRKAACEERKERLQRFWKAREDGVEGKRMELELV